jgi:transcriptional regulator with XRE-family HTH domain
MVENLFYTRLEQALNAKDMTQAELSDKSGISSSAISQYLSGKKRPGRDSILELSKVLDVSVGWLLFGEGTEPEPDLSEQRNYYIKNTGWNFRPEPIDGGRDYGNANIWTISWDIDALVRETIQNSLDAAIEPELGIDVMFSIIRLEGNDLKDFLEAIKWNDSDQTIGLKSHIQKAAKSKQQLSNLLKDGIRHFEEKDELILLRIDDSGAIGLLGDEFGSSHFAALCRNNLDSTKISEYSGGAFGLGKSVLWRASRFATVFFNSNLKDPFLKNGKPLQRDRIIGRSELAWHEVNGERYSGPGWFGVTENKYGQNRSSSIWENQALAKDIYLDRNKESIGTSILVLGFHDSNSDDPDNIENMAENIERAVARNFWPAIVSGSVVARVKLIENGKERRSVPVDAEKYEPELVDMYRKYHKQELVDTLSLEGDVAQRVIQIPVPKRTADPKHDEITHEAMLLVRLDNEKDNDKDINKVSFFRGQEMIIKTNKWDNLVFGGAPYRAIVMCGRAVGKTTADSAAEQFFRASEPPSHNDWTMTSELRIEYARGGKARIDRFFLEVRKEIQKLIKPKYEKLSEGPKILKKLLRITGSLPEPESRPKVFATKAYIREDTAWIVEGKIKVPEDRLWKMEPTLRFAAETGSGKTVHWDIEAISGCYIEDGKLIIDPGIREAVFKGISNPESHPAPAKDTSVKVILRNVSKE